MGTAQVIREFIRDRWLKRVKTEKADFVKDMERAGFNRRTVYRVIETVERNGSVDRKVGSGKKIDGWTKEKERRLCLAADHTVGVSYRSLGKRFKISKDSVKKILNQNGIVMRKRKDAPKTSAKQKKVQKSRIRKLSRTLFKASNDSIDVVMDDESFFDANGSSFCGNKTFLSSQPSSEPDNVVFNEKEKYPLKVLVWIAISKKGKSSFFIKVSKGAVNSEIYIEKCLKQKLIPFIRKQYPNGDYIFWPDLASCHYSKMTQEFLRVNEINFVPKELNPPNFANGRPIELFWSHLKRKVYAKGWKPSSVDELVAKVTKCVKSMAPKVGEMFMSHVQEKVRKADRFGPLFNIRPN